ncbi:hypothetical protein J3E69DRAFT_270619 [Trichoderma sp. SZMC 28015]
MLRSRQKKKPFNCDFSHDIVPSPRAIRPPIHDSMQHKPHQRSILPSPEIAPQAPVQLTAHSSKAPRAPPEPTKKTSASQWLQRGQVATSMRIGGAKRLEC